MYQSVLNITISPPPPSSLPPVQPQDTWLKYMLTHFAINFYIYHFWVAETSFAATVRVSVICDGTSSLANLCCIQARDMHRVSWGRWGKVSQMTFLSLVNWMEAKELMIKWASFSFPYSNGKIKLMVTIASLMTCK